MFDFRRITLFCLEKRLSKHKMTMFSKNLGGAWPLCPTASLRLWLQIGLTNTSRCVSGSTVVKIFFYALSYRTNGPRLLQNSWSQRTCQLNTRGVTQLTFCSTEYLWHWLQCRLYSLVFTPYLTHKKQQERDLGWTKVPYSRGGQIAARRPNVARGSIHEKSSKLKFPPTYYSKY